METCKDTALPQPRIALFDLDGTITDMNGLLTRFTPGLYKSYKAVTSFLTGAFAGASAKQPGETLTPLKPLVRDRPAWHLGILRRIVNPQMREGFLEVAAHMERRDIHTGIVSNGFANVWGWPLMKKYGLTETFDRYVFRETVQRNGHALKPAPEGILHALEKWEDELDESATVLYVGDMETDIIAAMNADRLVPYNIVPVAIGTHSRATAELRRQWASGTTEQGAIFKDYREMLGWFEKEPFLSPPNAIAAAARPVPA